MRIKKCLRMTIVAITCVGMVVPTSAAAPRSVVTESGIPVRTQIEDVALHARGELRGALVDVNGQPISNAPIAIGQSGKLLHELTTDSEGRFTATGMTAGVYQVASEAGVQNYRMWSVGTGPVTAKQGIVHVITDETVRAQCQCENCQNQCCPPKRRCCVSSALSNPVLVGAALLAVTAAVIISENSDDAS